MCTIINRKPKGNTLPAKSHYSEKTSTNKHNNVNQFNTYFTLDEKSSQNLHTTATSCTKPHQCEKTS